MDKIIAFTDGACSGNPGPGGYGIVFCNEEYKIIDKYSNAEKETTNNKMELSAVIKAMEIAIEKKIPSIDINSDSAYVVNAINQRWLQGWILNGWKTSKGEEVKNKEMWQYFINIAPQINFKIYKVKGHSNNKLNNLADELAVQAREAIENDTD